MTNGNCAGNGDNQHPNPSQHRLVILAFSAVTRFSWVTIQSAMQLREVGRFLTQQASVMLELEIGLNDCQRFLNNANQELAQHLQLPWSTDNLSGLVVRLLVRAAPQLTALKRLALHNMPLHRSRPFIVQRFSILDVTSSKLHQCSGGGRILSFAAKRWPLADLRELDYIGEEDLSDELRSSEAAQNVHTIYMVTPAAFRRQAPFLRDTFGVRRPILHERRHTLATAVWIAHRSTQWLIDDSHNDAANAQHPNERGPREDFFEQFPNVTCLGVS